MIRALTIVTVNLVVFEAASFLAIVELRIVRPNRRWDLFMDKELSGVSDATIASFLASRYDVDLGWDNFPDTQASGRNVLDEPWTATYDATGARVSCLAGTTGDQDPLIATYGDSFTHGDEVSDDATWQCALERTMNRRVKNYGVGGYGADQALLKAERHWKRGDIASITILAVYEDGLRRTLNRYRPFLSPGTDAKLAFKPSLRKVDDTVVLLPNPLRPDVATKAEVKALAISLIPTDYWASGAARVIPKFPYSVQLLTACLRAIRWQLVNFRTSANIWDVPEGREVILHLLKEFTDRAKQYGTRPVLLMIPDTRAWSDGRVKPTYAAFLRDELDKAQLGLLIIDIADASFKEQQFNVRPFSGHPSAYGNGVIAAAVLNGLNATPP